MDEPPWGEDRELSAELAGALIEEQFPALRPVRAVYLDEGLDSQAFAVGSDWLFRFPKRAAVERALTVERAILPVLAPRLPVPVPAFEHVGVPGPRFPHHFVGYRRLAGVSALHVDPARVALEPIAAELGALLTRLHAFPVDEARRLGAPDSDGWLARLRAEARPHLNIARRAAPDALVERCAALLEDDRLASATSPLAPRLVHSDLTQEHVLLATPAYDSITGVVDWGDLQVGDPTVDFAGLYHWMGEPLVRAVVARYEGEADAGLVERARLAAVCLGLLSIAYGLETGRPAYAQAGRRALAHAARAG